jgi:hypothetical protein
MGAWGKFSSIVDAVCCNFCRTEVPDHSAPAAVGIRLTDDKDEQFISRGLWLLYCDLGLFCILNLMCG